jgi:hypothetical protein
MSTSNNLDERLVLHYISRSFQNWGITYLTEDVLKSAKKNESSSCQAMSRLLFDLATLHIFNYEYTVDELGI